MSWDMGHIYRRGGPPRRVMTGIGDEAVPSRTARGALRSDLRSRMTNLRSPISDLRSPSTAPLHRRQRERARQILALRDHRPRAVLGHHVEPVELAGDERAGVLH